MGNTKDLSSLTDEELMRKFSIYGNQKAFECLYERYFVETCRYASWLLRDADRAKDIVQSLFIKIYQRPELFNLDKSFKVWLFSSTKNYWKNELKAELTRKQHYESLEIVSNEQETEVDNTKRLLQVQNSVAGLSKEHREVFVLKYANNLSLKEIADVCECSLGTVKSRLFYALKNMRESIKNPNSI